MCGRYLRKALKDTIIRHFELIDGLDYFDEHGYSASSEVFPGTPILAINNAHRPEDIHWTIRDRSWDGKMVSAINAKAETIAKVQMFRDAFKTDRVLIPATGLYEWQVQPDGSKVKYEIWFDEPLFAFGGIARDCEIKGENIRCGVIITTTPNQIFREIHNVKQRQAVVIKRGDYDKWLDPATKPDELKQLMLPLGDDETHFKRAGDGGTP